MMLSTVRAKLLAGRACRTNRMMRTGIITLRITEMIAHELLVRLLEEVLDIGDVLPGNGGFGDVGVQLKHLLKVLERGIEFGNTAGFDGLLVKGEAEGVVSEGILGIVSKRLLAI